MLNRSAVFASWCAYASTTLAGLCTSTPTSNVAVGLTTPPPKWLSGGELRRKRDNSQYVCGSDSLAEYPITCNDNDLACKATIFDTKTAFVYCSTSGVVNQEVLTTAVSNWPATKDCPTSTRCCYGTLPAVVTDLYVASGYTVTGWHCDTADATLTLNPAIHVLNPPSFSVSLADLTATSSSSTAIPTSASTGNRNTSPTNIDQNENNNGAFSGGRTGIGAGVGAAIGVVLIAGAAFFFWRRHQKKKERIPEISQSRALSPQQGHQSSQPPRNPAMQQSSTYVSYHEAQSRQGQSLGQQGQEWAPKYDQYNSSAFASSDDRISASYAGQSPVGWDQPHELPENSTRSPI